MDTQAIKAHRATKSTVRMQCLSYAYKANLTEAALLKDVGMAFAAAGRSHDAVQVLRKALVATNSSAAASNARQADGDNGTRAPDSELHIALGEALRECGELEAARSQWQVRNASAWDVASTPLCTCAMCACIVIHVLLMTQLCHSTSCRHARLTTVHNKCRWQRLQQATDMCGSLHRQQSTTSQRSLASSVCPQALLHK